MYYIVHKTILKIKKVSLNVQIIEQEQKGNCPKLQLVPMVPITEQDGLHLIHRPPQSKAPPQRHGSSALLLVSVSSLQTMGYNWE